MGIVFLFAAVCLIWALVAGFYFLRFFGRWRRGEGRWLQSLMIGTLCLWPILMPAQKLAWFPRTPLSWALLVSVPHGVLFLWAILKDLERGGT